MKIESKIARFNLMGKAQFGVALALSLLFLIQRRPRMTFGRELLASARRPIGPTPPTGLTRGSSSPQTYFNQVEFAGVGASANNNFAVNNVLDNVTGVAQMPMWELDYIPTNGNYTTLINPGDYHDRRSGQSRLPDGGRRPVEWKQPCAGQRGGDDHHHGQWRNVADGRHRAPTFGWARDRQRWATAIMSL